MSKEIKDKESLVQLGLRAIDVQYLKDNINSIRAYTQRLAKRDFSDIFLGIRNNRFTFYYYGRELFTMKFNPNDFVIETRKDFGGITYAHLNQVMSEIMSKIPLIQHNGTVVGTLDLSSNKKDGKYTISKTDIPGRYSIKGICEYLLDNIKDIMKKRYPNGITTELQVQGEYMARYNFTKERYKDLYMIDMEFILSSGAEELVGDKTDGRYDMIGLYKTEEGRYQLVFIELKSKRAAIKDKTSGINNHIEDMDKFLKLYNQTNSKLKEILVENIKLIIDVKSENYLKLFKGLDQNLIDYDNPEFWLLFDMVDKTKIDSTNDIERIIGANINKMSESGATLRFFKGCVRNNANDYIKELEEEKAN